MKKQRIISVLCAFASCIALTSCSIKFGFVSDDSGSSSEPSSRVKSDNSIVSEILGQGYSDTDMGESYKLDGNFSMLDLRHLDDVSQTGWRSMTDDERYETALNFLNFWAYYGDDASIRFKPSELVSGITDTLKESNENISVLDAALSFAVSDNTDKYLALIGVIDIEDTIDHEGSGTADD